MVTESGSRERPPGWDWFNKGQRINQGQGHSHSSSSSGSSSQVCSGAGYEDDGDGETMAYVRGHCGWLCHLREEFRGCARYRYGPREVLWVGGEARIGFLETMFEVCLKWLSEGEEVDGAIRRWEEEFEEDFDEFVTDYLEFWRGSGASMGLAEEVVTGLCRVMQSFAAAVEVVDDDDDADEGEGVGCEGTRDVEVHESEGSFAAAVEGVGDDDDDGCEGTRDV